MIGFRVTVIWNKWSDTTCIVLVVLNIWIQFIIACGTIYNFIFAASANKIPGHKKHSTFEGLVKFPIMHAQQYFAFGKGLLIKEDDSIKLFCSTENSIHGTIIPCTGYSGYNQ